MFLRRFLFIYLALFVHDGYSQTPTERSISGKVTDEDGFGLAAYISIHELRKTAVADLEGDFVLDGLKPGIYHLHFTHMGFGAVSTTVNVRESDAELEIVMKETSFDLQTLTIEANPFKNGPIEQSHTIEVVDREFFEKSGSGTFANALEKLPGISTINTGIGISKPIIRGLGFNRILVNDRGIKQEGQQWGADHGLEIDPFDVDRVEVIKGPASLIYGSDGMSGVINISPAPLPLPGVIRGHLVSNYKSNNKLLGNSAMVEGNKDDFVFKGRFTMQDFQDYRVPADNFTYAGYLLPIYDNRLKNTAGRERHFSLMGGVRKNWGHSTLTVSQFNQISGLFTGAVGIPNSYNLQHNGNYSDIDFPRQDNSHLKIISNSSILLKENWLEIDLGYQRNARKEESLPHNHGIGPTPEGNLALGLDLDTYTANVRHNRSINGSSQGIMGMQFQYMQNKQRGFEFLLPDFNTLQGGLYYFHEYKWGNNLFANAGLRVDAARHHIREFWQTINTEQPSSDNRELRSPGIEKSFFNASGSAGLSWVLHNNSNLKLNIGSGYRIPTAIEMATNGIHHGNFRHEVGNPDLNSERSYQADINYSYTDKTYYFSVSPFFSYYDGFIYLAPTGRFSTLPAGGTVWEYRQNNAVFAGAEIKSQVNFLNNFDLSLVGEYVYNQNLNTHLPLPLTPPLSVTGSLEYRLAQVHRHFQNFYAFVEVKWVGDQNRVDRNEMTTDGYSLLDAGLGWETRIKNHPVKFQVSGNNLTDVHYYNHLSRYKLLNIPEQGRNILLSLKIPFSGKI